MERKLTAEKRRWVNQIIAAGDENMFSAIPATSFDLMEDFAHDLEAADKEIAELKKELRRFSQRDYARSLKSEQMLTERWEKLKAWANELDMITNRDCLMTAGEIVGKMEQLESEGGE